MCGEQDVKADAWKQVLLGLDGRIPSGQVCCILGPSGAGKTSLLDILSGRQKSGKVSGLMALDAQPRKPSHHMEVGYVMQDDALLPNLSVRETFQFAYDLRVPTSSAARPVATTVASVESALTAPVAADEAAVSSTTSRDAAVDAVIRLLHLQKVADSRIGSVLTRGLSGGERRRVSIGEQMVLHRLFV